MQLEILSPEATIYQGDATAVQFPGSTGSFQVLDNHAAMIASLQQGDIRVRTGEGELRFEISGGFVEVLRNQVSVLVERGQAVQ